MRHSANPGRARGQGGGGRVLRSAVAFLLVPLVGTPTTSAAEGTPVEARALLQPLAEAVVSAEITGRIIEMDRRPGDRFAEGDTLVRFDCAPFAARLRIAKAALDAAENTLRNKIGLQRLSSAGDLEVALAEAGVEQAKGEVEAATYPVSRCRIRAPFPGRVVERPVNPHETVAPGTALMSVIDDRGLEVKLVVPSGWLSWLGVGMPFTLLVDETGRSHAGEVVRLGARIDAVSQSVAVFGTLTGDPSGLLAGMSGTARFAPPGSAAR